MGKFYQVKFKQSEDYKKHLKNLTSDYEATSRQISSETNWANRRQLQRQRKEYAAEMEAVAQQCDQIEADLKKIQETESVDKISDAAPSLIPLLTSINLEIVTQAYRASLPEGRPRPVPDNLEEMVRQLAEVPGENDNPKPLGRFVSILSQESSLETDHKQALQVWAERCGFQISSQTQPKRAEHYLMLKVQPRSLNDSSLGYLLSAAIVNDPDPLTPEVDFQATSLSIPEPTNPSLAPGYSLDELPQVLSELVTLCGGEHGIPLTDLTVQWFLPIELMSLPIEHWQIKIGRRQKPPIGQRCKSVIVRSYDRQFTSDYEAVVGDWKKYWRRFLKYRQHCCSETLMPLNPRAGKTKIAWDNQKVVGCAFVEHHEQQRQEDFWDDLLAQGSSIVLWERHLKLPQKAAPEGLDSALNSLPKCTAANLPKTLSDQRREKLSKAAEAPEADRLKAAPLSLLWDNPFRPFPQIDYESA